MNRNRPHWSYSALRQYLQCPLQYYFQRVVGLKPAFTSSGLILGSSVHEALATYHRAIMTDEPITGDAVRNSFIDAWNTRKSQENVLIDERQSEEAVVAQGVGLIEAYLKEPPPQSIVAVEEEMISPIHNSEGEVLEKPLVAVIDLMTEVEESLHITDLKTSSRSYSDMEADVSLQATCYLAVAQENFATMPTFEYAVLVKTKNPRVQRLTTTRTEDDLGRLGDLVQMVDRAVDAGIFYPVESPLNCSTCSFRTPCREWGRPNHEQLLQVGLPDHAALQKAS